MKLEQMTAKDVMEAMDNTQPNWHVKWSDQRALQESLALEPLNRDRFLRSRVEERVWHVLQAVYALSK